MYHVVAMKYKYISKFTKEDTDFQGWRLALKRGGIQFVRYFSALEQGSMEQAEAEAIAMRTALLADLERNPGKEAEVMERYRKPASGYPAGLKKALSAARAAKGAFSARLNPMTQQLIDEIAGQWDLTRTSVVFAALYMFLAWSRTEGKGLDIQKLSDRLEELATKSGLPPFSEFAQPPGTRVIQNSTKEARTPYNPLTPPPSEPRRGYYRQGNPYGEAMSRLGLTPGERTVKFPALFCYAYGQYFPHAACDYSRFFLNPLPHRPDRLQRRRWWKGRKQHGECRFFVALPLYARRVPSLHHHHRDARSVERRF